MVPDVLAFERSPDLRRLFGSAVLNARSAGTGLADVRAERTRVPVDPAGVVDYAHVCGFTVGAHPPVTWPHLVAFPLQAAIMSRADFPLPMVGLVHVANRITWSRPLEYGETLDVFVHAEGLRPHRRGRQVDLVASVRASGDGEVWRGVSTYLSRGPGDESATVSDPPDVSALRSLNGGAVWRFDEGTGRRYAAVSGDVNPIHLAALTAKAFGFDRAIAHGMYTYARVLASLGASVPAAGSSAVWFRRPVKLPSTVLVKTAPDLRLAAVLPRKGDGEHLVATVVPAR